MHPIGIGECTLLVHVHSIPPNHPSHDRHLAALPTGSSHPTADIDIVTGVPYDEDAKSGASLADAEEDEGASPGDAAEEGGGDDEVGAQERADEEDSYDYSWLETASEIFENMNREEKRDFLNQYHNLIKNGESPANIRKWIERKKRQYGPRRIGLRNCPHIYNFYYVPNLDNLSTQKGTLQNCPMPCKK